MILSMILVPFLLIFLTVVIVGNPAPASPGNGFVDPMVDEPRVLSPEVVAKVNDNWLRNVKPSMAKEYELQYKKFGVNTSFESFLK